MYKPKPTDAIARSEYTATIESLTWGITYRKFMVACRRIPIVNILQTPNFVPRLPVIVQVKIDIRISMLMSHDAATVDIFKLLWISGRLLFTWALDTDWMKKAGAAMMQTSSAGVL